MSLINIQEGGHLHIELCVLVREALQLLWSIGQVE
jgi:hypothetical protein